MSLDPDSKARFNLSKASVLLAESTPMGMDILVQILTGFGAKSLTKCENLAKAGDAIAKTEFDLMILDSTVGGEDTFNFVRALRHEGPEANRFAPVLIITAHTQASRVARARDCGAHFLIAKPLTPMVVFERIVWIAREQRPFVASDTYVGPERRFKFEGSPMGTTGRRKSDLSGDVGQATEPNMSQDQIDALMQPRKVAL